MSERREDAVDLRRRFAACSIGHDVEGASGVRFVSVDAAPSFASARRRWLGDGASDRAHGDEMERASALEAGRGGVAGGACGGTCGSAATASYTVGTTLIGTVGVSAALLVDALGTSSALARFLSRAAPPASPFLAHTSAAPAPSTSPSAFSSLPTHILTSFSYLSWLSASSPPSSTLSVPCAAASLTAASQMWSTSAAAPLGAAPAASCATSCSAWRESGAPSSEGGREGLVMRGKRSS